MPADVLKPQEKWDRIWSRQPCPPFVIAELSGNHGGSFDRAKELIAAAADAGADAIKLQTYTAATMTLPSKNGAFVISDPHSLWFGRTLYDLYTEAATPWEWHAPLFEVAKSLGLLGFSSPFDHTAVDYLDKLDVPCFKIASFELTDLPLIRYAAGKGKPLILSTGMATLAEIDEAVSVARNAGAPAVALLKCSSRYPARVEHVNLRTLVKMGEVFDCPVGFSDHTLGTTCAITAVALGATFIEKHLVLNRGSDAIDAGFSADPAGFAALVQGCKEAYASVGEVFFGGSQDDRDEKRFRRSLYVTTDLQPGDVLTPQSLRIVRPGLGLEPRYYELVLGKKVRLPVNSGTPLAWRHVLEE